MKFVEVLDLTIKNHPMISEIKTYNKEIIHFATCPCGFRTKYSRHEESILKAFQTHIADETNELLIENNFLNPKTMKDKKPSKTSLTLTRKPFIQTLY